MSQSLSKVWLHVVFSTKHRRPFLREPAVRDVMTRYLIGTLRNIKCPSLNTGVVEDHVHILCSLHRTASIAQLVEQVKTSFSSHIKEADPSLRDFHWQNGYAAFSVSPSNVEQVKQYVSQQEAHHLQVTFQDEFRRLLRRHGIEYDERYVWD
jgi:REP element-mobilizing transposase RayT